ncbi:hypothetical protein K438DRAFT_1881623 [Mycena galopus ATCC 62051]|nr:hypothetical protein K438DRAFT_1881623 [Mycena galopus ATCC 62051]
MRLFFLLLAAALGASAAVAPRAPLEINTPCAIPLSHSPQCEPLLITWSGGIPPYVVRSNQPIQPTPIAGTGPIPVTETSFTWIVNATLGQSLLLLVTDDEGDGLHTVTSAPFQVIAGAGDGCINKN